MVFKNENYKDFFKGKKITQIGLGLLGRGVGDAEFLAECGADLIVTDKKSGEELKTSVDRLARFKNIKFTLGEHRLDDFKNLDFILKGAGVPLDSPYITEARKNNIPIEMDASLFMKLAPKGVKIIGITGTRGKTTTTMLIYEIVKKALDSRSLGARNSKVYLGGNIKDMATLPLLKEVKAGDYVVMELDSWQLQGFGESGISPNVAVFTTFMEDHMNYYGSTGSPQVAMEKYFADKANIFKYQKSNDILVAGEKIEGIPETALIADAEIVPKGWNIKIPGEHNKLNIVCAILVARALKIPEEIIKEAVENFSGVAGRLEFIREINGVKIYNDTTATTPTATMAGIKALGGKALGSRNIVLILGGSDKGLDMSELIKEIPNYCKAVILLPGTGTTKMQNAKIKMQNDNVKLKIIDAKNLDDAVEKSIKEAVNNDIILFSPAFASFGMFKNEYDRGEKFNKIVGSL